MSTDADTADAACYESLIPWRQAIVDAIATDRLEGGDRTQEEIAELLNQTTDYSAQQPEISRVLNKYPEIIDQRVQTLANGDNGKIERGNVTVEGELDLTHLPGEQHLAEAERPTVEHDDDADDGDATSENDPAYTCEGCGDEFPEESALYGHQRWCDEYDDSKTRVDDTDAVPDPEPNDQPAQWCASVFGDGGESVPARLDAAAAAIDEVRLGAVDEEHISELLDLQVDLQQYADLLRGEQA